MLNMTLPPPCFTVKIILKMMNSASFLFFILITSTSVPKYGKVQGENIYASFLCLLWSQKFKNCKM